MHPYSFFIFTIPYSKSELCVNFHLSMLFLGSICMLLSFCEIKIIKFFCILPADHHYNLSLTPQTICFFVGSTKELEIEMDKAIKICFRHPFYSILLLLLQITLLLFPWSFEETLSFIFPAFLNSLTLNIVHL